MSFRHLIVNRHTPPLFSSGRTKKKGGGGFPSNQTKCAEQPKEGQSDGRTGEVDKRPWYIYGGTWSIPPPRIWWWWPQKNGTLITSKTVCMGLKDLKWAHGVRCYEKGTVVYWLVLDCAPNPVRFDVWKTWLSDSWFDITAHSTQRWRRLKLQWQGFLSVI